jgi:hypothetical protein
LKLDHSTDLQEALDVGLSTGYWNGVSNLAGAKHQIYHTAFAYYANGRITG